MVNIQKLVVQLALPTKLGETVVSLLQAIQSQGVEIMSTIAEVQAALEAVQTAVAAEKAEVTAALTALTDQIATLQAAIDAGAGVTAADLDGLKATAEGLISQVNAIKE